MGRKLTAAASRLPMGANDGVSCPAAVAVHAFIPPPRKQSKQRACTRSSASLRISTGSDPSDRQGRSSLLSFLSTRPHSGFRCPLQLSAPTVIFLTHALSFFDPMADLRFCIRLSL